MISRYASVRKERNANSLFDCIPSPDERNLLLLMLGSPPLNSNAKTVAAIYDRRICVAKIRRTQFAATALLAGTQGAI
jgi:hypothetical protein